MNPLRRVLVYGGSGALGRAVVSRFKTSGWHTIAVDFNENLEADRTFQLDSNTPWQRNTERVSAQLRGDGHELHAVINVAGGWHGGAIRNAAVLDSTDRMIDMNFKSSVAAAHMAANNLTADGGLLILTGSAGALDAAQGHASLGYCASKAAVHFLVEALASGVGKKEGLPANSRVVGVLPLVIDTPANRASWGAAAKPSEWTSPEVIASLMLQWASGNAAPQNGALLVVKTHDSQTSVEALQRRIFSGAN